MLREMYKALYSGQTLLYRSYLCRKSKQPTDFKDKMSDCLNLPPSSAHKRRYETMERPKEIHSSSQASPGKQRKAALKDLFNTVVTVADDQEMKEISKNSITICSKVIPHVVNDMVRKFADSDDNLNHSILTLYRGGLISKAKYNSVRSSLMFKLNE